MAVNTKGLPEQEMDLPGLELVPVADIPKKPRRKPRKTVSAGIEIDSNDMDDAPVPIEAQEQKVIAAFKALSPELDKIYASFGQPENKAPAYNDFDAVHKIFNRTVQEKNALVLHNDVSAIRITENRIQFTAAPAQEGQTAAKPEFTAESAFAMAYMASKNARMVQQGIKLTGTKEQQKLLRAAVKKVNESLPADARLKIRGEVSPSMTVAAFGEKPVATPGENASEKAAVPAAPVKTQEEPVAAEPAQQPEQPAQVPAAQMPQEKAGKEAEPAAPQKKKMGFLRRLLPGRAKAVDADAKTQAKPAKDMSDAAVMNRRKLMFGGAAAVAATVILPAQEAKAGFLDVLFPPNDIHEKQREASGSRPRAAAPSARAKRNETPKQRQRRLKREKDAARQEARRKRENPRQAEGETGRAQTRKERAAQTRQETRRQREQAAESRQSQRNVRAADGQVIIVCSHTGKKTALDFSNPNGCRKEFNRVTADRRTGETCDMNRNLIPYLGNITSILRSEGHKVSQINIISGFRSAATNEKNREASLKRNGGKTGVAKNSPHIKGLALDIAIPGVSTSKLYSAACRAGCNGVGKYSRDGFVHVDAAGPGRRWGS